MEHSVIPIASNHAAHRWLFANQAEREAESVTDAIDIGKLAIQQSDNTLWRCSAAAPAQWTQLAGPLAADLTLYVRADGDDSNDGRADTAERAFLTVQCGIDAALVFFQAGHKVKVKIADGTYQSAQIGIRGTGAGKRYFSSPMAYAADIWVEGNITTPANVVLSLTTGFAALFVESAAVHVDGFKVTATAGSGQRSGLVCDTSGALFVGAHIDFGSCVGSHIQAGSDGFVQVYDDYTISGDADSHYFAWGGGRIEGSGQTIALTGSPNFSNAFAVVGKSGILNMGGGTFTGACTGKRFIGGGGGAINLEAGDGLNYFPGNAPGMLTSGARYNGYVAGPGAVHVADLPDPTAMADGTAAVVDDAVSTTFLDPVVGGAANTVPVKVIGGSWLIA